MLLRFSASHFFEISAVGRRNCVAGDTQSRFHNSKMAHSGRLSSPPKRYALCSRDPQEGTMLFTIAVILLVLWLLGLVSGYTLGNFIYVLLVIAVVLFVVGLVSGRRTV